MYQQFKNKIIMIFKSIPLLPTKFSLDVWICDDLDELSAAFSVRYGASVEYYKGDLRPDAVEVISSTEASESRGDKVIVMNMQKLDAVIVLHEVIHVVFKLSKITGIEICQKSQEWVAYFVEYIYEEILKMRPD
jgi:hypothetical protein